MKQYEYPPRPEGDLREQIARLWEALFRLVEQLNAEASGAGRLQR